MTADELIANFETLAEAPDGLKRLRELMLQLAVSGKLVPQDPGDEPATVPLVREAEERARLGMLKKRTGKSGTQTSLGLEDAPFQVPDGWTWVCLDAICDTQTGSTPPDVEVEGGAAIAYVKPSELGHMWVNPSVTIPRAAAEETGRIAPPGSVLFVGIGGTIGKCGLLLSEATFNQQIHAATPWIGEASFLLIVMAAPFFQSAVQARTSSTAIPIINKSRWGALPVPFPPLPEQHRIVAKVDELMSLLDRLDAARKARETARTASRDSALQALRDAATPDQVQTAWTRVANHLDDLITDPADIEPLRQTILQLAVRGKLVSQDPRDESVSALLGRIAEEKGQLCREGRLRKADVLSSSAVENQPFGLPSGWRWVRVLDITLLVTDGDHQPPPQTNAGVPFVVIGNLSSGQIDLTSTRFVSRDYYDSLDWSKRPQRGDLLYTVTGSWGIVLRVDQDDDFCVQRHIGILKISSVTNNHFLGFALRSAYAREFAASVATGIAQKTVPLGGLRSMPIPAPPLAEQNRIVAKVDELLTLLHRLEERLRTVQDTQASFAAAAVHHLG